MANIRKREGPQGVRWQVQVRIKGRTRTATFKRKSDARQWANDVEGDLGKGRSVPTSEALKRTLGEAVDRYLDEVLPTKPRNRDRVNRERHLRWWKEQLGDTRLYELTPDTIARKRDAFARGDTRRGSQRTGGTVNRYLVSLSHLLSVARKQWRWVDENAAFDVPKLEEPKGRVRFLDENERKRLLEACRKSANPNLYPIVVVALSTGMRRSEILGLRWPNVDLKGGRLVLHVTKNRDRRVVPLAGLAHELMEDRSKIRRLGSDLVFPGRRPDRPHAFRHSWYLALNAAQLTDFKFHDLRHTAASYLAMNGASLVELSEILGHRTLAMVKRYAHLSEQHTAAVVGRMNKRIFG